MEVTNARAARFKANVIKILFFQNACWINFKKCKKSTECLSASYTRCYNERDLVPNIFIPLNA